ncbi:hypothetical protein GCM10027186_57210 [Micromonospora schwarzwaldensis]
MRPIQPPITEPSPRPAARDSAAAVRDTELATFARKGIFASVTRARLPDHTLRQIAADGEPFGRGPHGGRPEPVRPDGGRSMSGNGPLPGSATPSTPPHPR